MNPRPKQLSLPFDAPRRPGNPMRDEVLRRLARIESRLVQLMKHEGMTSDGRSPLPATDSHGDPANV